MALIVGLDVGTTSAKAVAFTESGEAVAEGRARTPWRSSRDGVEMDTYDLAGAVGVALDEVITDAPAGEPIVALGITSMGESGVLLDAQGEPVAPVIAWHDTRDGAEVEALRQRDRCGRVLRDDGQAAARPVLADQAPLAHHPSARDGARGAPAEHRRVRGRRARRR